MLAQRREDASAPVLPVGCYKLTFLAEAALSYQGYRGSAWRGVFGHSLKKLVCITREKSCPECLLYRACVYPYVFETPPPPESAKLKRYTAAPHPFVLVVPAAANQDAARLTLGVNLFGRGNHYLPYIVHSLERAAADGLRPERIPLSLAAVEQQHPPGSGDWSAILRRNRTLAPFPAEPPSIPSPFEAAEIVFHTPLRIRLNNDHVTPEVFRFSSLFGVLLRRFSLLTYFHAEQPLETDFAGLTSRAKGVELLECDLKWREWTRYSSRQKTKMQMGGVTGRIRVETGKHPEFWPFLWLGQYTHAGKGTSMGFGRYEIKPC